MDIGIQLVPVVSDGELLVVINWNVDLLLTSRLVIRVVELGYIWMSQSLVSRQSLAGIELEKILK